VENGIKPISFQVSLHVREVIPLKHTHVAKEIDDGLPRRAAGRSKGRAKWCLELKGV
jgi:hypothetical protein